MTVKDYYEVLGVPRIESIDGIHQAFRELAKRHHPDRAGPEGTRRFREISEAYETLSNPRKRAAYDRRLRREEAERALRPKPEPLRKAGEVGPEPLIPEPISIARDFERVRPSVEALYERILRNFSEVGIPKGEHAEAFEMEIHLTRDEASRGGTIPVGVPVLLNCPYCGGSGSDWGVPCEACDRRGRVVRDETVRFVVPAGVPDGAVFERSLGGLGVENLYLRLRVRVMPD